MSGKSYANFGSVLKGILLLSLLALLGGCASIERLAIPNSDLISTSFTQSGTQDPLSHEHWNRFLGLYAQTDPDGVVRVNYGSVSDTDHKNLKGYIANLSAVDTTVLSKNAQLAYWANLYNAATVDVILDHYPVESIRDIRDSPFDLGPWENKRLSLRGRPMSLHDIEHGVVRAVWRDTPEIHYILNCASTGCPNLPQTAYSADTVEDAMRNAAAAYVNDPVRGVNVSPRGRLKVSKIYAWYRDDFGSSDEALLDHLRRYAEPDLRAQLELARSIGSYFYDWSLNDASIKESIH
ncbi:DUF547 domain-containing protein [Congregibacter variabilis]|uniref:DUF547 domain-containing protein n=1 Tax=Congregibacter variabilis TaxID=3081200 RepID=A0ABZ0I6L3_9GAMM|nr:DUF547 domain-containing protein [Congregibacter sp. IMCC43200]